MSTLFSHAAILASLLYVRLVHAVPAVVSSCVFVWQYCFSEDVNYLWLLESLHPLFLTDPRTLGGRGMT